VCSSDLGKGKRGERKDHAIAVTYTHAIAVTYTHAIADGDPIPDGHAIADTDPIAHGDPIADAHPNGDSITDAAAAGLPATGGAVIQR
jgi:hypothetical protein